MSEMGILQQLPPRGSPVCSRIVGRWAAVNELAMIEMSYDQSCADQPRGSTCRRSIPEDDQDRYGADECSAHAKWRSARVFEVGLWRSVDFANLISPIDHPMRILVVSITS
jgi:hypothetical protein